jgi:hypothetical protein
VLVLRRDFLYQVKRHLGVDMLAGVDRVKCPAAVDDRRHPLCIVTGPGDKLQPINDGCRRSRYPQHTLVFVQVSQDGGKKVGVVEVCDMSHVAAAGLPDEPGPGGDDEDGVITTGLNCPLQLDVDMV